MNIQNIIATKRDNKAHSQAEIEYLVNSATDNSAADYQLSAWLVAAYINGLNMDETVWLTQAMANSGDRVDLSRLNFPCVDKHSTGGVGDKITVICLPILAACGLRVVKMSGRGLGITGGTYDKMLSVPGFSMELPPERVFEIAEEVGCVLTGQTLQLAPADKVFYALRDATATVDSMPLITASILSKKIASGADNIVMDVKCGAGAFMRTLDEAQQLAEMLETVGRKAGLNIQVVISDMNQPLGRMVGNALEIREVIDIFNGKRGGRLEELYVQICAAALQTAGLYENFEDASTKIYQVLSDGSALQKAKDWFAAQGADIQVFDHPESYLPQSQVKRAFRHEGDPVWVSKYDAYAVGSAVLKLGGGRVKKEDSIDYSVGIESFIEIGQRVEAGDILFEVHASDENAAEKAGKEILEGIEFSSRMSSPVPVVLN